MTIRPLRKEETELLKDFLYEAVGFKTIDENAEEYIMVCEL